MNKLVLEMHWSNNPIPLNELIEAPDFIFDIPLGLFTPLNGGTGSVSSVNGKVGTVVLNAADVGADALGTAASVQDALSLEIDSLATTKLDAVDYVQHFRGVFSTFAALESALPTALDGDYAHIDSGPGFDRMVAVWDSSDTKWVINEAGVASNTDEIAEGSSNLYFSGDRVRNTPLTGLTTATAAPIASTDLLLAALAKLQAQISAKWVDISTLAGYTKHANIDEAGTKIELSKQGGMIWIRGYFKTTASISVSITCFLVTDTAYLVDSYHPNLIAYSTAWLLQVPIRQISSGASNFRFIADRLNGNSVNIRLVTDAALVTGSLFLAPTCLGKALNP